MWHWIIRTGIEEDWFFNHRRLRFFRRNAGAGCKKKIYQRTFFADLNSPPIDADDQHYDGATAVGVFAFDHIDPNSIDEILRVLKPGAPLIIGLNEKFYDKGTLEDKFGQLEKDDKARIVSRQLGEHLPGAGIKGWVIDLRKS